MFFFLRLKLLSHPTQLPNLLLKISDLCLHFLYFYFESEMKASRRRALQEQLVRIIMRVLCRNQDLHYYQVHCYLWMHNKLFAIYLAIYSLVIHKGGPMCWIKGSMFKLYILADHCVGFWGKIPDYHNASLITAIG